MKHVVHYCSYSVMDILEAFLNNFTTPLLVKNGESKFASIYIVWTLLYGNLL